MTITVLVNGAFGKMGSLACTALEQDSRFTLSGKAGRVDTLSSQIQQCRPQVVVDLTRADVAYENARTIIEMGVRPVIGTSGLTPAQIKTLMSQCEQQRLGGLIVPNFSIGVLLMIHFAKKAARFLESVEIIEMHHAQKFDAPSGTALKTATEIARERLKKPDEGELLPARGELVEGVPIHSLRLPGILAKQSVIFGALGETLTITHECIDRQSFMPGLLLACEQVLSLNALKYGLEHVIEGLG